MIKHIGKHNDKNAVVVFREVPGEDHMALVIYPDTLPQTIHDSVMKCIESAAGQEANNLADALHTTAGGDGVMLLTTIHKNKWMKKVRTQDVVLNPGGKGTGARLDEINEIVRGMEAGGEAAAKMAKIDATQGMADPAKLAVGEAASQAILSAGSDGVLSDADIASNLVRQAEGMQAQVATITAEITRLTEEAQSLNPALKPKKKRAPRKKKVAA
jgi:hypothetical protein|tara:strand:+ start:969 stop:1613 length:645 start_codon:yes stop_codon:yes gene_type:complete